MPPACAHGAAEAPCGPSIRRATGVPWPSMTTDAYAPTVDATTAAVGRLVACLAEEAMFAVAGSRGDARDALEGAMKRRADAHVAVLEGKPVPRMIDAYDAWLV